jgi:hypothetical protein
MKYQQSLCRQTRDFSIRQSYIEPAGAVRMGSVTTTASCPDLGGQGRVDATHASGASMTLCTHGGHLVSWKTAAGDEM